MDATGTNWSADTASGYGGIGLTNQQMKQPSNFTGWIFTTNASSGAIANRQNKWLMAGYPHLQAEWRQDITTVYQLQMITLDLSNNYYCQ